MATSQEPSTPPAIPEKHPGRLSRVNTFSSMKRTSLMTEYLDIWEHATLLYHGFEWQSAAETFLMLSQHIERQTESTLCLLNAAIIFARLDDFAAASQILDEVDAKGDILPLAMFIMGHVEFEQGNYEKSEDSFKIALSTLSGPSQSYDRYGLVFNLRASHIQQNLRIFETKSSLFGVLGSIGALPADGVFEAPSRPYTRPIEPPAMSRTSSSSDDVPTLSDGSTPASLTSSPIGRRSEDVSGGVRWYANRDSTISSSTNGFDFGFGEGGPGTKTTSHPIPPSSEPWVIGSLVRSLAQNQTPIIAPPRKLSRNALVPREARVHGNLTSPLANFIRQLPSQNALEPRSPTLESAPTRELADFLKGSGPQESRPRPSLQRTSSDQSAYSGSWKADSIRSEDLRAEDDLTEQSRAQETPEPLAKHSKHPYRSGVGSILLRENSSSSNTNRRSRPTARQNDSLESTRMDTDSLHSFLTRRTSDRQSARSYVFTDEVSTYSRSIYSQGSHSRSRTRSPLPSRPVSMTAVHPALRPAIPSRNASLRRAPSQLTREVNIESPTPTTSVVVSTNYSNLKPASAPSTKEETGYSRFFGRIAGKLR